MNEIESLVSNVGFPIAIALFFGIVLYKVFFTFFNKAMNSSKEIYDSNKELVKTNQELVNTNKELVNTKKEIVETNKLLSKDVISKLDEIYNIVK